MSGRIKFIISCQHSQNKLNYFTVTSIIIRKNRQFFNTWPLNSDRCRQAKR